MTEDELYLLLINEIKALEKARQTLEYSYEKCKQIGDKNEYTNDELVVFESLSSRFARVSDILIQKIFRLFDVVELEEKGSVIDTINKAEKRGLINSAEQFRKIRILRNKISHEYRDENIEEIFKSVMNYIPKVLESCDLVVIYSKKYVI
jgi:uncharacterized protein YutE (UPF0331/DUF86 family)